METIKLPKGEGMTFCQVPAGAFMMGSRKGYANEEPEHRVALTQDYWMGQTPVTQAQFAAWKPEHENSFSGEEGLPVEQVTWEEAVDYCAWMTGLLERVKGPLAGWQAKLPTEAQWERACLAGKETDYHSGDGKAALHEVGWYDENSGGRTHPVGNLAGNGYGLHDMHGNVQEWCLDCFDAEAYAKHAGAEVEDPFLSEEQAPKEEDSNTATLRRWAENLAAMREDPDAVDKDVLESLGRQAHQFSQSPTGEAWGILAKTLGKYLREEPLEDADWELLERWGTAFSEQVPKTDDPARVVRGGSWLGIARLCRAACRNGGAPGLRFWAVGFRVCLVSGPVKT